MSYTPVAVARDDRYVVAVEDTLSTTHRGFW